MHKKSLAVLCLFLLVGTSLASDRLTPKQLAGPASDFLTGYLAPVDLSETGIRSKSALLPIKLEQLNDGSYAWHSRIAVDSSERFGMMMFVGDDSWRVSMREPNSREFKDVSRLYSRAKQDTYGISNEEYVGDHYEFNDLRMGTYTLQIIADAPEQTEGYVLLGTESSTRLYAHQTTNELQVGNEIGFVAYGFDTAESAFEEAIVADAIMRVTSPYGDVNEFPMYDDGFHNDDLAGDGIFGGDFTAMEVGNYQVQIVAKGMNPDGSPFLRTTEHVLPVIAPDLMLDENATQIDVDENRIYFDLKVDAFDGAADHYRVLAEVWGTDAEGSEVPVSWIGGMVYLENDNLSLSMDARWLALAQAQAPLTLRNVRIQDANSFVNVAKADEMPLPDTYLPAIIKSNLKTIDEEMLMGPRPLRKAQKRAGSKLLLVHGYCSGNAWGNQQGYFANSAVFQDFNQNRSHDQFANLIGNFGSQYDSFGIVAHSQGGAAALHLYTYYWSGLDNASGNRLIQSVGTPYQGTALAGNLAALGSIFGAGCGTNNDLTYNGASSWLNGIPSWARSKVNYYTTSFTDKWWRYDYCHLATDLFLSDPDDGTTEKSKGQLSGGVNRGHKTGQCHTTGMRDKAQYQDGGRNTDMSNNAAR